jgi:3-oxoacyl-[acyl-carrier protein] reductase
MAVELAPHGITVNAVSPSPVLTDQWGNEPESRRRALSMRVPLGRVCSVEDVAHSVLYLVGPGGSFVTGADIPVTGGEMMHP